MSHNVVPPFQITGPSNVLYNGTFCLPQVPLPANTSLQVGDNITIQVVESAQHGAALYNVRGRTYHDRSEGNETLIEEQCVDVVLAEPDDPEIPAVNPANCFNSSDLGFQLLFTTTSLSGSQLSIALPSLTMALLSVLAIIFSYGFW